MLVDFHSLSLKMTNQDSWLSCEKTAVLQGGFLLANKLCQPASLSALQKEDWVRVGQPILQAVREICGSDRGGGQNHIHWRKKVICILWTKLLGKENGEDVEVSWKENPFFSLQSSLPEVNHAVLFELVKSMPGCSETYSQLLLCLPPGSLCAELDRLVNHVSCNSTVEDVRLLLEVWWELWKGRSGLEDELDKVFMNQCARPADPATKLSTQAAKRFKSDPDTQPPPPPSSSSTTDVLSILLRALVDMKSHLNDPDLCFSALSICLDSLYTSYLIDQPVNLPAELKLKNLSRVVTFREKHAGIESFDLVQVIREAQRDLRAAHTPSQFKPCTLTLTQTLQTVSDFTKAWEERGLLRMTDIGNPSLSALCLKSSLQRVITTLEESSVSQTGDEMEGRTLSHLQNILRRVLDSLSFPDTESSSVNMGRVAVAIIDQCLDGFQDFTVLFVTEVSWALNEEEWISCLVRNKNAFQQKDVVMKLVSTLVAKCQTNTDVGQCRKLKNVIVDIFSELPLAEKNAVLATMLTSSSRGLHSSLPHAVTEGFSQELNMSFNCIIQGGAAQGNLRLAVSAVARVAFQNPEATVRRCCHLAVVNLGAHRLFAQILHQLWGLRGAMDRTGGAVRTGSLLCCCLQETMSTKLSSAQEEDQFLHFLVALLEPSTSEGTERGQSFLTPEDAVCAFVLPHLSPSSCPSSSSFSVELSLRLLHSTLSLDSLDVSPHWVMNCSPFPLLYILSQLLNQACRCWEEPPKGAAPNLSMDTKELVVTVLTTLGKVVGREVASAPNTWSRALFWLYDKVQPLDWTVRFHLKPVWGEHFKNEVPSSLLDVCELSEQEWSGLEMAQYGPGTGLLAWMEGCALSDQVQTSLLGCLSLDQRRPDHVNMFSKGLLVAVTQTLPWCTVTEWGRTLRAIRQLLQSGKLHVPYSLEYVEFLPLLDLRGFSCELRLSVLLLRVLQLLCGSSCSDWLPTPGWAHVGRLYATAMRELVESLRSKLPLSSKTSNPAFTSPQASKTSTTSTKSPKASKTSTTSSPKDPKTERGVSPKTSTSLLDPKAAEERPVTPASQEVLFVLSQLFCHVQHAQVMMPGGQSEALFLCALEILTHYEAVLAAHPDSSSSLENENTRHFFTTITENLGSAEMKAVLHQKIAQLMSGK